MAETVDLNDAGPILHDIVKAMVDNAAYLSELDGATGDGDHGVNMSKGFRMADKVLKEHPQGLGQGFGTLAETLLDTIGGSTGPLYGSFFLDMSTYLRGRTTLDRDSFGPMLRKGLDAVIDLGGAKPGDKSLVDVLAPALAAYEAAATKGGSFRACLEALKTGATEGFESTKTMIARIGRASRLGERSRGTYDAGAASSRLMLIALADGLEARIRN